VLQLMELSVLAGPVPPCKHTAGPCTRPGHTQTAGLAPPARGVVSHRANSPCHTL